jgi:hypothetical protein
MVNCRYLLLCVICILMGACESQPSARLSHGLVRQTDFTGPWKWRETSLSVNEPSDSGYGEIPAADIVKQRLLGYYESDEHYAMVVHRLQRYAQSAPDLGEFQVDTTAGGPSGKAFDPGVTRLGNSTEAHCVEWSSPSFLTACVVEVRYTHILSILDFKIDGGISKTDIEQILNEALTHIDERVREIDLQLSEQAK